MNDEEQIRHLLATYAQRTDDGDAAGKAALFAEDAHYLPTTGEFVGRAAIYDELARRQASRASDRQTKHVCSNSVITIEGDTAEASTDYVVYQRSGQGPWTILVVGRYLDRFVRHGSAWLYAENRPVSL